jgi:MoxR-like ATPase
MPDANRLCILPQSLFNIDYRGWFSARVHQEKSVSLVSIHPDFANCVELDSSSEQGQMPEKGPALSSRGLDPVQVISQIKRAFVPLERELVGFGPLLIQAVYALLTRENLLIFSPAGTAKTLCANMIFSRIAGASVFDTQLSKGTLAEELCGSLDIEQMKRGRAVHNTHGTLVDADLAFVDEFFDANDMVLRALLGIFNERVFKKGVQTQPARLHTGIAAANYVRATAVTEAVLDRFLLRAYIAPDYSPFNLLAIDQAFARNYGRPGTVQPEQQIPLSHLHFLADIVRGRNREFRITAPPHVLFMKNAVINRYRELVAEWCAEQQRQPPYISPRTYAKSRFVLNAAALLSGRQEVSSDDLSELKYVVTTVGGQPEEEQCFDNALRSTLLRLRDEDRRQIDDLTAAHELAEHIMADVAGGSAPPNSRFLVRVMRWFGLVSQGQVTFDHVRRFVENMVPADTLVRDLRLGVIQRLQELIRRVDRQNQERLF